MLASNRSLLRLLFIGALTAILSAPFSMAKASQPTAESGEKEYKAFLPLVRRGAAASQTGAKDLINQLRANAGVPSVQYNITLDNNCYEHARYMVENNFLTHIQDPDDPYFTPSGQTCARQANVWLGSANPSIPWAPEDAIRGWMDSVEHRIWLLYPTSKEFGFAFYRSPATKRAGAAVDILSGAEFGADEAYNGWPIRYPGSGEREIPATKFPITLNWRYFGPEPVIKRVHLTTGNGTPIAHTATAKLSYGQKGIQIIPKTDLPKQSRINVTVSGSYEGKPFTYSWYFFTGTIQYTAHPEETFVDN